MTPFFTIIIPVYNVEKYLVECLDSVLQQDFNSYEIICVNDGSTDGSLEILEKYQAKFPEKVCVYTQPNAGLSATRNKAIEMAKGEYLLFLDSDDWLKVNVLSKLHTAITNEKADIIAINSELYNTDTKQTVANELFNHSEKRIFETGLTYFDDFVQKRKWGPSAVCFYAFKTELLRKNNLRFPIGLVHEDELFMPQALYYSEKVIALPEIFYVYRVNDVSITKAPKEKNFTDKLYIAEQLYAFFSEKKVNDNYINRSIYNLLLSGIHGLMNKKEGRKKITKEYSKLVLKNANTIKEKFNSILIIISPKLYYLNFKFVKNRKN